MSKTNIGLSEFVQSAYANGWGYVYGTIGQMCTVALLDSCAARCPGNDEAGGYMRTVGNKWLGRHVADCAGLIKAYIMDGDYISAMDIGANTMFNRATEKGVISTLPEIPGLLLHAEGHVGVYIGGGYAIEARGTEYGVVKTVVKNRSWTHWFKSTFIEYTGSAPVAPAHTSTPAVAPTKVSVPTNIYYRVKTAERGFLAEVKNLEDYAGIQGQKIIGVAMRVDHGSIRYAAHVISTKTASAHWCGDVTECDITNFNKWAGNNTPIDAIRAYYYTPAGELIKKAVYWVSNVNGGYYDKQYDTETCKNPQGVDQDGYAGYLGHAIDRLQMHIV